MIALVGLALAGCSGGQARSDSELPEVHPASPVYVDTSTPREPIDFEPARLRSVSTELSTEYPTEPSTDPFEEWMENPTFTCPEGTAPGWLGEDGVPTSCVAN